MKARLLADVVAAKPGEVFTLGILLTVDPGWHVYWSNPGDAGTPTTVKVDLAGGMWHRQVEYPIPKRFVQPGGVTGYGYDGELLLISRMGVPALRDPAEPYTIKVTVAWLACKDVCIPGKADLKMTLATTDAKPEPANQDVFGRWSERFPAEAPVISPNVADYKVWADVEAGVARMAVVHKGEAKEFQYFPGRDDAVEMGVARITHEGGITDVVIPVRILPGRKPADHYVNGVLAWKSRGKQYAVRADVPVYLFARE